MADFMLQNKILQAGGLLS